MDHDGLYWTTEAMIRKGGGFVQGLGDLIRAGEPDNQKRLIAAFPAYWGNYKMMGIAHRAVWAAED